LAFSINAKPQENLWPHIYFEQHTEKKEKMGIACCQDTAQEKYQIVFQVHK